MLEIRNLTKIYRSKTGDQVRALDNVSISFPESGMVFILGKSGSGKSTLLNVMGGLDSYDSGEFVIKGKSSKDFGGSDFDAYRNTFIGFIFQEYNVLDDFSVGANIGLALELQGKKATDERINSILSQVDLLSYAKRKPNELSGGQKQRVAIARALVKEPQIIMADEPTGALDSNTGKQIFDTLKALSREKLVLVVSHDRDFAERYADRIVELSDGRIISDVTKHEKQSVPLSDGIQKINDRILRIKGGYRLTEVDLKMINDYLSKNDSDIILSGDGRINDELRSAAGIGADGSTSVFEGTNAEKDYTLKPYRKEDSKFIRSRLPIKNALKMGTSGLKHKKFRLAMTIFLSLIAFTLFGFANTMATYEKTTATINSLLDSNVKNASVTVGVKKTYSYSDGDTYSYYERHLMNEKDIETLRRETGLDFVPVFTGGNLYGKNGFSISSQLQNYSGDSYVYSGQLSGFVNMNQADLASAGFTVAGRLPEKEGEIAIPELIYRQFNEYGFQNKDFNEVVAAGKLTMAEGDKNSIIGKHISFSGNMGGMHFSEQYSYEIVGVIDTQFDYGRYSAYLPKEETVGPEIEEEGNALSNMVLTMELSSEQSYGFHYLGFLTKTDIETLSESFIVQNQNYATYMHGWNGEMYISLSVPNTESEKEESSFTINQVAGSSVLSKLKVTWLDGTARTTLAPDEIVIPYSMIGNLIGQAITLTVDGDTVRAEAIRLFGEGAWNATDPDDNYMSRLEQAAQSGNKDDFNYEGFRESLIPLLEQLWKIDAPDGVSANYLSEMFGILRETGENNPEYKLDQWRLESLVRNVYGYEDFHNLSLLQNQKLIDMLLASDYGVTAQQWSDMREWDRENTLANFYTGWYLMSSDMGFEKNAFGGRSGKEFSEMAQNLLFGLSGSTITDLLDEITFEGFEKNYTQMGEETNSLGVYDL